MYSYINLTCKQFYNLNNRYVIMIVLTVNYRSFILTRFTFTSSTYTQQERGVNSEMVLTARPGPNFIIQELPSV